MEDLCSLEGCDGKRNCRGLCQKHYARLTRRGTVADPARPSEVERFWSKVKRGIGCWTWTAASDARGYGAFNSRNRVIKAHRFAYENQVGPIPDGLAIDHICHNTACVRPDHLRPVTSKQNAENHSGARRQSKSGARGVYWHAASKSWLVQVRHDGVTHTVGYFSNVAEAEVVAIAKRNELHTHNNWDRVA